MDCMHWVNRDSYLPQGSRGLKVRQMGQDAVSGLMHSWQTLSLKLLSGVPFPPHCCHWALDLADVQPRQCARSASLCTCLQMVTKYKLGYDPVEVDPEDMVGTCVGGGGGGEEAASP